MHPACCRGLLRAASSCALALVLLLQLSLAVAAANQCTLTSQTRSVADYTLGRCLHHRDDTCCSRIEAMAIFEQIPVIDPYTKSRHKGRWESCQRALEDLMCFLCAGEEMQTKFAPSGWDDDIRVCEPACWTPWFLCDRFSIQGVPFHQKYPTPTALCEAQGFRVDWSYDSWNRKCYPGRSFYLYDQSPASSLLGTALSGAGVLALGAAGALASLAFGRLF